jgi:hypothetical protein
VAVDLGDLLDPLTREINSPGVDSFPDATEEELIGHLSDAFWHIVLDGVTAFDDFTEEDGLVTNTTVGGADLDRGMQQLIVLYAGARIVRNQLKGFENFRAKAGPVEYETSQSANLLRDILADMNRRIAIILGNLSEYGRADGYYVDMVTTRTDAVRYGNTPFLSGTQGW